MGSNGSRVLQIDNISDRLAQCQQISQSVCPIYGKVHYVSFQNMEFFLGESQPDSPLPHRMSLHYLVKPNLLLFPNFTLLEQICPQDYNELLSIIKGISEMAIEGGHIGIGYGRVAYNARWGLVGQKEPYWPYYQVLLQNNPQGVYLSPQLMIALSQGNESPRIDFEKADVFALAVMIVEMIFQQKLDEIYDYENYQIYLNPLLEKISMIKDNFGQQFARVLISMLEIQQADRIDFTELLDCVEGLMSRCSRGMLASNNNQQQRSGMQYSRGNNNRTPSKLSATGNNNSSSYSQKSPKAQQQGGGTYRNDVSPFRGRFGSNVRPSRTPQRQGNNNRSPIKRDMKINSRFDKENTGRPVFTEYNNNKAQPVRQNLSPLMRR